MLRIEIRALNANLTNRNTVLKFIKQQDLTTQQETTVCNGVIKKIKFLIFLLDKAFVLCYIKIKRYY